MPEPEDDYTFLDAEEELEEFLESSKESLESSDDWKPQYVIKEMSLAERERLNEYILKLSKTKRFT